MTFAAPLALETTQTVAADWIDYNGHMNVAYYSLAFDRAYDQLLERLGMDEGYRQRTGCSSFTLESHLCFLQEVRLGDSLRFTCWLLDHDAKRLHFFGEMTQIERGYVAATHEWVALHVDLTTRRSTAMHAPLAPAVAALALAHAGLPRPARAGRRIGLRPAVAAAGAL
ncbi:MAG: hypothetical protein FJX65_17015 [Alphaproteobacteria bacterium]|nr:hypothetical protein [Alphaproteobacteria bacterium]